ncbi:zinc-binding alcohol dehydrogenase family protein [Phragmitibacter flavus]|uniref:Zinc-type alcohol dehydrogenase-like protein n=1 Tax=Phragmitibacter flavus TaxID=2576071 RepID=A0A5R8KDD2_9BACT|nr:zinc-binding alcohol dehydrogenase family protein [Phragmitibacter flavus]TLD70311.1 zinc-binding alcohol dehydrogenase family protein [Phragmitibacter flavus]
MKAVGYRRSLPVSDPDCLLDVTLPDPVAKGRDLLVQVKAVSVNPVDAKQRKRAEPAEGEIAVLGYDAAGVVVAVGDEVTLFKPGDEVWYAGSIARPGTNSELHVVDERIAGRKPKSLDFAHAAALPLTTITAWELLFDRLRIPKDREDHGQSLLIVGAAGGVGSILTQLARRLTGLKVIGTASREETQAWVKELGAHEVIDHRKPLSQELKRVGIDSVTHVAGLTHTDQHIGEIVESLAPFGNLALIDDPAVFDVKLLKRKALSLHWELMFTRSLFQTADMVRQHEMLNEAADLVDAGVLRTTFGEHLGEINAANLKRAHELIESNTAKGKMVLEFR